MRASPIEILWTAVSFTGFVFSVLTLIAYAEYRRNALAFPGGKAEQRKAIQLADDYLWGEGRRCFIHVLSLQVGIWAMFLVDPARCSQYIPRVYVIYGVDVIVSLILINMITALGTLLAYLSHRRWKRIIEDEEIISRA